MIRRRREHFDCPRCGGDGVVPVWPGSDPQMEYDIRCPTCGGRGVDPCPVHGHEHLDVDDDFDAEVQCIGDLVCACHPIGVDQSCTYTRQPESCPVCGVRYRGGPPTDRSEALDLSIDIIEAVGNAKTDAALDAIWNAIADLIQEAVKAGG